MKGLKVFSAILCAGLGFALFSCSTSIFTANDTEMAFDANGHVKEAVAYTAYDDSASTQETISYSKDGAYEEIVRSWDGSAWSQSDGYRGTYAYAPATRTMTINFSARWITDGYVNLDASSGYEYKTVTNSMILGKRNQYAVYTGTAGSFTGTGTQTNWNDMVINMTITITVPADLSSYTMLQTITGADSGGTIVGGMQGQLVYTIDHIFPSDATSLNKAKGKTITITTNKEVATTNNWVSGTTFTPGTPVTDDVLSTMTMSISPNGTFLAMDTLKPFARLLGKR